MLSLKIFFKLLPYIWPFVREMVLGKKPLLIALRDNKKKLFFITLILISFGLNFVAIPRLVSMSMQYIALEKRYKELETKFNNINSSTKHPKANGAEQQIQIKEPAVISKPATPTSAKTSKKKVTPQPKVQKKDVQEIHSEFIKLQKAEAEDARLNY